MDFSFPRPKRSVARKTREKHAESSLLAMNSATVVIPAGPSPESTLSGPFLRLLERSTVEDVVGESRPILILKENDEIKVAFEQLRKKQTFFAPVVNSMGNCIGFVEMIDLVAHGLNLHPSEQHEITHENAQHIPTSEKFKSNATVGEIVQRKQKPLIQVHPNTALLAVIDEFSKGARRAVVVGEDNKPINTIAQFDMGLFLVRHSLQLKDPMELNISQMYQLHSLGHGAPVKVLASGITVMETIRMMDSLNLSGIALVNETDQLVGNFSAADMQLLCMEWTLPFLTQRVSEFLDYMKFKRDYLACFESTTIEAVLLRMALEKVHRLYVVNEQFQLVGTVSLTDIMRYCMRHVAVNLTMTI